MSDGDSSPPNPNPKLIGKLAGVGEEGEFGEEKKSCEELLQITQVTYIFTLFKCKHV
jgi:hypothetical protein